MTARLLPLLCLAAAWLVGCEGSSERPAERAVDYRVAAAPAKGGGGPTLKSVSSRAGATDGVCRVRELLATFDVPMDPASIDSARFVLTDQGVPVPGRVSLDASGRTARFVPADPGGFAPSRTIVAAVIAGAFGVRSRTGRTMAEDRVWVFSTGWQPCVGDGIHPPVT